MPLTTQMVNQQNRQFWLEQSELRDKRMSDEVVFRIATNDMCSETARWIPIKVRKSLEQALADAENT